MGSREKMADELVEVYEKYPVDKGHQKA